MTILSTYSAPPWRNFVVGADWPRWQRNLYPATYTRDPTDIRRQLAGCVRELGIARRCMAWALKQGDRHLVAAHRREIDRQARFARNCETQLRLIENRRLRLVA